MNMNRIAKRSLFLSGLVAAMIAAGVSGCNHTATGAQQDIKENTAAAAADAKALNMQTHEAGEKVAETVGNAGEEVKEGATELSADAKAAKQTVTVKAALMADKSVDASDINVDTSGATKILTLNGTVPSRAQKNAAEKIAKAKTDGYQVKNLLRVRS